jgi:hypothetical protein
MAPASCLFLWCGEGDLVPDRRYCFRSVIHRLLLSSPIAKYQLVPDGTNTDVPGVRYVQQPKMRIVEVQYGVDWPGRLFRRRVQVPLPDAAEPVAVGKKIDLIAV